MPFQAMRGMDIVSDQTLCQKLPKWWNSRLESTWSDSRNALFPTWPKSNKNKGKWNVTEKKWPKLLFSENLGTMLRGGYKEGMDYIESYTYNLGNF